MTQIMGALLSVALVAGVGVWGYKLIMRDVSGVPIVQATEGPMRVAPENPGGRQADHQGLAVNEVAGRGAAAGPADQLVLAPTPVDLSEEDAPNDALRLTPVAPSQQAQAQAPAAPQAPATLTPQDAAIQALADQIAAGVAPLTQSEAEVETPPVVTSVAAPSLADIAPEARSPRPVARPQNLRTASVAPKADTTPAAGLDIDPATLPAGTRLVQLGAYDSADVAQTEWARIAGRFDSFFDGKRRVIERAQSGGRTFYRLRAEGFGDLADARRFCAALVAERADCIPVVTR
ncbi:SPOR domain-containing protein [Roseobacteraceae bacterium S113]